MADESPRAILSAEFIAQECVAVRLRLITRAISRLYNRALRPYGLTISQMNILVAVSYLGEAKHHQICQALSLDKSTLSRDVERMHAKGWLTSLAGDDGRASLLRATATGKRLLGRATPAWQQAQQQARELLGEPAVASLARAVSLIRSQKTSEPV